LSSSSGFICLCPTCIEACADGAAADGAAAEGAAAGGAAAVVAVPQPAAAVVGPQSTLCPICLESVDNNLHGVVWKPPCNHRIHVDCIRELLRHRRNATVVPCPQCRAPCRPVANAAPGQAVMPPQPVQLVMTAPDQATGPDGAPVLGGHCPHPCCDYAVCACGGALCLAGTVAGTYLAADIVWGCAPLAVAHPAMGAGAAGTFCFGCYCCQDSD